MTLTGDENTPVLSLELNSNVTRRTEIKPFNILMKNPQKGHEVYIANNDNGAWVRLSSSGKTITMLNDGDVFTQIDLTDGIDTTTIKPNEIITPKLTQTSLEGIKKNISLYNEDALETILNSDIYSYNLKSEKDTDSKHIGFVIGDKYRTPKEIISNEGNAIELYSTIGILWKAVQELSARVEQLEKEVQDE